MRYAAAAHARRAQPADRLPQQRDRLLGLVEHAHTNAELVTAARVQIAELNRG